MKRMLGLADGDVREVVDGLTAAPADLTRTVALSSTAAATHGWMAENFRFMRSVYREGARIGKT